MLAGAAAATVVAFHFAFITFALAGAALLFIWPKLIWLHLPALAWGGFVEFTGRMCPLTAIEDRLRDAAGQAGYGGDFIEHYLLPVIYPAGLMHATQLVFGAMLIGTNAMLYLLWAFRRRTLRRR